MTRLFPTAVFAVSLAIASPLPAQSLQAAYDAATTGDWAVVYANVQPLAEQGNAEAQLFMSSLYGDGSHVQRDQVEAARWTRLSAVQGYADAQYAMGSRYLHGSGLPQDDVLAHIWFELATLNGNVWAAGNPDRAQLTSAQLADAQNRINTCVSTNYQTCE